MSKWIMWQPGREQDQDRPWIAHLRLDSMETWCGEAIPTTWTSAPKAQPRCEACEIIKVETTTAVARTFDEKCGQLETRCEQLEQDANALAEALANAEWVLENLGMCTSAESEKALAKCRAALDAHRALAQKTERETGNGN